MSKEDINGMDSCESQDHINGVVLDSLWEIYGRIENLEANAEEEADEIAPLPKVEGHPMPQYDPIERGLDEWQRDAKLENLELTLLIATVEYAAQHQTFNEMNKASTKDMRAWGAENYKLHRAMIDAANAIRDWRVE